jgi:hypothetical protein
MKAIESGCNYGTGVAVPIMHRRQSRPARFRPALSVTGARLACPFVKADVDASLLRGVSGARSRDASEVSIRVDRTVSAEEAANLSHFIADGVLTC